jgi:hypothetical protein|tara:strand:+ start:1534 stop:1836 length:303 start_codon:yes stop_codon:yes gene_type:complete
MSELKAGQRLKSGVCDAEVMVIKAGGGEALTCGGVPMTAGGNGGGAEADAVQMGGCQIGKRYVNDDGSLEVLCVKPGRGSLAADGNALAIKGSKTLPSAD